MARVLLALLTGLILMATAPALAGWHSSVVVSGSMAPAVRAGDVVVARPAAGEDLELGRLVVVRHPLRNETSLIHRLVAFTADGRLVLRGDRNPRPDSTPVSRADVIGRPVLRVPFVGLPAVWIREGSPLLAAAVLVVAAIAGMAGGPAGRRSPRPRAA